MLGRKEPPRHPARPDGYSNLGPVSLPDAWDELSRAEFGLWCRLCAEPPENLYHGRKTVAGRLGYSYRQFNELLRLLVRRGYLSVVEAEDKKLQAIVIERRGIIGLQTSFVRLK